MKDKMFKVWKTIKLGKKPDLSGINISSYAQDMLDKIKWQKRKEKIDLVEVSVGDLGFNEWTTTKEIYKRAQELGLDLCPPEVGAFLRASYKEQSPHKWLFVGMEQITDRDGNPNVFSLARSGDGLWLGNGWAPPGSRWAPGNEFAFRLRKLSKEPKSFETLPEILEINGVKYKKI